MMTTGMRWEHGSDFEWFRWQTSSEPTDHPWADAARYYGSGRDALRALLDFGRCEHGWRRLLVPSYYCQEVLQCMSRGSVSIAIYDDDPTHPSAQLAEFEYKPGDVVLIVNHFGQRSQQCSTPAGVGLIEDHTHDPWSDWAHNSEAAYCFASLRKTLPLPDGGVVWSPTGEPVPAQPAVTLSRQLASAQRLAASVLKRVFLDGGAVEKPAYRDLYRTGEGEISAGQPSGMTSWSRAMLEAFPATSWRLARHAGWRVLSGGVHHRLEVLERLPPGSVPYGVVALFDNERVRNRVRETLMRNGIYAAVLWELGRAVCGPVPAASAAFSQRMLFFHCDGRYTHADLDRVADEILLATD